MLVFLESPVRRNPGVAPAAAPHAPGTAQAAFGVLPLGYHKCTQPKPTQPHLGPKTHIKPMANHLGQLQTLLENYYIAPLWLFSRLLHANT